MVRRARCRGVLRPRSAAWLLRWLAVPRGATTAEYALLLALVVITLIGTLSTLGGALNGKLQGIINSLNGT